MTTKLTKAQRRALTLVRDLGDNPQTAGLNSFSPEDSALIRELLATDFLAVSITNAGRLALKSMEGKDAE